MPLWETGRCMGRLRSKKMGRFADWSDPLTCTSVLTGWPAKATALPDPQPSVNPPVHQDPRRPRDQGKIGVWCRHPKEGSGGQVGGLKTSTHLFGLEDNESCLRDEHTAGGGARSFSGIGESPSGEVASTLKPEGDHVMVSSQSDQCRHLWAPAGDRPPGREQARPCADL